MQVPPVFSAVKVDGKRAYKLARKGHEPELKAKPLQIDEIELLEFSPEEMKIRVVCSKGTYIRALARDIGMALESGAHLTALRRTRVGDVGIDCCLPIDEALERISECPLEFPDDYRLPAQDAES